MKVLAINVWIATFVLPAVTLGQTSASYPNNSTLQSPDRKHFIINSDDMSGDEPQHHLYLVEGANKVLLYSYRRSVEVFWCPSSDCVVVNDFEGSNVSNVYLINISPERKVADLGDQLFAWMKDHNEEEIASSCDHVYAYASKVSRNGQIRLVLTGYNGINPNGFSRNFAYQTDGRLTLIKATDKFAGVH